MKNKIKSYGFWISLSGAVVVFVEAIGRFCGFIANADLINNIIMSFAGVLVVCGLVSMPIEQDPIISDEQNTEEDQEDEINDKK